MLFVPSDDEVGGCQARSAWSELGERNNQSGIGGGRDIGSARVEQPAHCPC
jgi:hypothetical protein